MRAAITFDVDGLQRDPFDREPSAEQRSQLHDVAHDIVLPRIAEWLQSLGVRATFFSIGTDVERSPRIYQRLAADGHEIANHSHSHLRDFSRQPAAVIRSEIRDAHDTILKHVGVEAVGFRAPGYTVTPAVIEALTQEGYRYDASLVPSWSYTTLKHVYRLVGKTKFRSYLVAQSYGCAAAPRLPFRVAAADIYRPNPSAALTEIPITTWGAAQLPFVHGLTFRLPRRVQDLVFAAALRQPFFTMSFHDLEFADRSDFGSLPASGMTEPHLASGIGERLEQLSGAVRTAQRTHRFVTMRDAIAEPRP
jgi:peptidoglycan-N-acetylglucosamine deacetylase